MYNSIVLRIIYLTCHVPKIVDMNIKKEDINLEQEIFFFKYYIFKLENMFKDFEERFQIIINKKALKKKKRIVVFIS